MAAHTFVTNDYARRKHIEEEEKQSKAVPLVLDKEESQMSNTDRGIQDVLEQINWTNVALRGMVAHTFVTNDYARRIHIDQL